MLLNTSGINIDELPIKVMKIVPKSVKEYEKEIQKTIDKVIENGKKGIAVFVDTQHDIK